MKNKKMTYTFKTLDDLQKELKKEGIGVFDKYLLSVQNFRNFCEKEEKQTFEFLQSERGMFAIVKCVLFIGDELEPENKTFYVKIDLEGESRIPTKILERAEQQVLDARYTPVHDVSISLPSKIVFIKEKLSKDETLALWVKENSLLTIGNDKEIAVNQNTNLDHELHFLESFDFEVYLPSKGMNLKKQDKRWTEIKKQQFLQSVILRNPIPTITLWQNRADGKIQVIDGKQRLQTIISYLRNELPMIIEGEKFFANNNDYVKRFFGFLKYNIIIQNEPIEKVRLDTLKVLAYEQCLPIGTTQDEAHLRFIRFCASFAHKQPTAH